MAREEGSWVPLAAGLLMLEFLLLHSGAFMAIPLQAKMRQSLRLAAFCGMALFYGLLAWVFSLWSDSAGLVTIYASVVAGRLLIAFTDRDQGVNLMLARSAVGVTLYLTVLLAVLFVPLPEWGITGEAAELAPDMGDFSEVNGAHFAVAWAVIYFLFAGLMELALFGYLGDPAKVGRQ